MVDNSIFIAMSCVSWLEAQLMGRGGRERREGEGKEEKGKEGEKRRTTFLTPTLCSCSSIIMCLVSIGGRSGSASTATAVPNSYEGRLSRANKSIDSIIIRTVRLRNSACAYIVFLAYIWVLQSMIPG